MERQTTTTHNYQLLRLPEVEQVTGLKRSSIYQQAANGTFPKPIKIGARASAWRESEIIAWANSCAPESA